MDAINLWAVLTAAAAGVLLGALWYSRILFGEIWRREAADGRARPLHPARIFGVGFVLAALGAGALAWLLGPGPVLREAAGRGLLLGALVGGTSIGINAQFFGRSAALALIDAGYHTAQFGLSGMILGMWP